MVKYDREQRLKDMGGNANPQTLRNNQSRQSLVTARWHRQCLYARDSQVHRMSRHARDSQVHVGSQMHSI
jgi:hypothetical protein